ncbi:hypothetical protein EDF51_1302 [Curtobacterium sp. PhB25]|nr:hypothetical protein EDF51_1302 [Curtobacterium sp. PhB25]
MVASSVLDDLFAPLNGDHRSGLLRTLRLLTQGE